MSNSLSNGAFPLILSILALLVAVVSTIFILINMKKIKQEQQKVMQQHEENKEIAEQKRTAATIRTRPPREFIPKARIEWMNQTKEYTGELITYSSAVFQASKRIILNNLEIKEKTANNYTYKDKSINISKYNENLEKFKITKAKLQLSYVNDMDTQQILDAIEGIDKIRKSDYGAQIHSNLDKHDKLEDEYNQQLELFIQLSKEYFDDEWEKIKRGR